MRLIRAFSHYYLGEYVPAEHIFETDLRDAVRRGDRYTETSMRRQGNSIWLVRDRPDEARRNLDRVTWTPPERGYHVQHWYELWARTELALYEGTTAEVADDLLQGFDAAAHSLLLRVQILRAPTYWLRGRLCLALAARESGKPRRRALRQVARSTRRLRREGIGYADVFALLLQAGLAVQRGDPERAGVALRAAVSVAEDQDMAMFARVARRRLGEVVGGDEGAAMIAEADAWMREQRAENPERVTEVFAPGFAVNRSGSGGVSG